MSQPRVVVEMQDEPADENVPIVPVDSLRQTFFSDLDASSKVNPNRQRRIMAEVDMNQAYNAAREIVVGAFGREESPTKARVSQQLRGGARPSEPREDIATSTTYLDMSEPGVVRVSVPMRQSAPPRPARSKRDVARVSTAFVANVVAGSLVGAMIRRCVQPALMYAGASVVVMQTLSFLGYAQIQWRALASDVSNVVLHGVSQVQESQGTVARVLHRSIYTLTETIPRRLSFWVGAIGGFLLL